MPNPPMIQYDVRKNGIWNTIGTNFSGVSVEHYIKGDGVTALPGAYYTGSGWILPNAWVPILAKYVAFTTPGVPPAGPTTDWVRVFNHRIPSSTPTIASLIKSDNTASNILAPFYAQVTWGSPSGGVYESTDKIHVTWFQNGASIASYAVDQAAGSDTSPVVYYHGDTYQVMLAYYDPDSGNDGPTADSGSLTY